MKQAKQTNHTYTHSHTYTFSHTHYLERETRTSASFGVLNSHLYFYMMYVFALSLIEQLIILLLNQYKLRN